MSELGDLIVEQGPFTAGQVLPIELLLTWPGSAERINALRDELIELRRVAAAHRPSFHPGTASSGEWDWQRDAPRVDQEDA